MIKEGKIGVQESICIVVIAISNRVFFTALGVVARVVGPAGWYMAIISDATTILVFTFICLLLKRFPGKNILEIFDISFGRFIGFIFSFTFTIAFLVAAGVLLREFIDVLKIFIFPLTPISIFAVALVIVIVVAAFLGFESIARVAKLAVYPMLFGLILLFILAIPNYKFANLFPVFGYGLDKTIIEGLTRSAAYSEVIVLTVFAGSLQGIKHIKKAGYISLILSGLIISSSFLCVTMSFPYTTVQEQAVPLYILARSIQVGIFAQRLDPILLFVWIISTIIACSIVFYASVSSYCKTFRLQDKRPIIIPLAVLLISITMIPKDFASVVGKYIEFLRIFPIFLFYILPLVALIVVVLRKKKGENSSV